MIDALKNQHRPLPACDNATILQQEKVLLMYSAKLSLYLFFTLPFLLSTTAPDHLLP